METPPDILQLPIQDYLFIQAPHPSPPPKHRANSSMTLPEVGCIGQHVLEGGKLVLHCFPALLPGCCYVAVASKKRRGNMLTQHSPPLPLLKFNVEEGSVAAIHKTLSPLPLCCLVREWEVRMRRAAFGNWLQTPKYLELAFLHRTTPVRKPSVLATKELRLDVTSKTTHNLKKLDNSTTICYLVEAFCGRNVFCTLADTCMLFSCMFMMASEILTSIGSITDSMLNGPSNLSATKSIASVKRPKQSTVRRQASLGSR